MTEPVTIENLLDVALVALLEQGGVDNWEWYYDSLGDYERSEDEYEDARSLINSLENGGVDNWEWYDESTAGFAEYEEYLNSLDDLSLADSIWGWKEKMEQEAAANPVAVVQVVSVPEKRVPKGEADNVLYDFIVAKFGADKADDIFELTCNGGVWKHNTFPVEYKKALKEIKEGVESPLEVAKRVLIAAVIKNGKFNTFLDEITS